MDEVVDTDRSPEVSLSVVPAKLVANPLYQDASPPNLSEAMLSCPRENIENLKELLQEENFYMVTEAGEQERLPVLMIEMKESDNQKAYASRGCITVAVDTRYHGECAKNKTMYRDALISAWSKDDTIPFIFDTVSDLIKLTDYLKQREDIDASKIRITGESLRARIDLGKTVIDKELVQKVWDQIAPGLDSV